MNKYITPNKIYNHPERLLSWASKGKTSWPITLEVDMSNICNDACPNCAGGRSVSKDKLSYDFVKNIIDENPKDEGIKAMVLTGGGEPLTNPDTLKVMQYAKMNGIDVGLITNLRLINEEKARIISENCEWARGSIGGGSVEAYKLIHGKGKREFEQSLKGLELLVEARKKNNKDFVVGASYLTKKGFANDMHKYVKIVKNIGGDYAQFNPFHYNQDDMRPTISKIQKENKDLLIISSHRYKNMENRNNKKACYTEAHGAHFRSVLTADGSLYADCFSRGLNFAKIGKINRSFSEVWNSPKKIQVIKNLLKNDLCPPMSYHEPFHEKLQSIKDKFQKEGEIYIPTTSKLKHINFVP